MYDEDEHGGSSSGVASVVYGRVPEQLREPETPGSRRRRARWQIVWLLLLSVCVLGLTNGGGKPLSSEERTYLDAVEPLMLRAQRAMMNDGIARSDLGDTEAIANPQRWPLLRDEALALQPPQRFQAHLTLITATSCYAEQGTRRRVHDRGGPRAARDGAVGRRPPRLRSALHPSARRLRAPHHPAGVGE